MLRLVMFSILALAALLIEPPAGHAQTTFEFQKSGETGDPSFQPLVASITVTDAAVASGTADRADVLDLCLRGGSLDVGADQLQPVFDPHLITFSADRMSITILQSGFLRLGPFSWQSAGNPGANFNAARIAVTGDRVGLELEILAEASGAWVRTSSEPECRHTGEPVPGLSVWGGLALALALTGTRTLLTRAG